MRNLLTRVPKSAQRFVATIVRSIFAQPDAESVHELHARIVGQLGGRFPAAAALLEEAGPEILAFTSFPKEHGTQLRRFQDGIIGEAIYQKPVAERVGCTYSIFLQIASISVRG
jgi:transposase-like protein